LLAYRALYRATLNTARGEMRRSLESIANVFLAEDVFGAPIAGSPPAISDGSGS
jgi:hypothetical protein